MKEGVFKHRMFPAPSVVTEEGFLKEIKYIVNEFTEGAYTLHARPHYNSGAPQCLATPEALASAAMAEFETYVLATQGTYGDGAAEEARKRGAEGICFITWRTEKTIEVYDVLTRNKSHASHGHKFFFDK